MKSNKALISVALILAAVLLLGIGFAIGRNSEKNVQIAAPTESAVPETTVPADEAAGALGFTIEKDSSIESPQFSAEDTGNQFTQGMVYYGISGVNINVNGSPEKLEDALKNGDITKPEIFLRARQDAANGVCEESFTSKHGVAVYTYTYPDFSFWIMDDIFEAPDGVAYPVSELFIYNPAGGYTATPEWSFREPETGRDLTLEDWGLTFELEDLTSHGATVVCTQTGGQQIGQLKVTNYDVYFYAGSDSASGAVPKYEYEIPMNSSCLFPIDWSETYGELPSGKYRLGLWISDIYDESQVHPLMDNFRDWQVYEIEFEIP